MVLFESGCEIGFCFFLAGDDFLLKLIDFIFFLIFHIVDYVEFFF